MKRFAHDGADPAIAPGRPGRASRTAPGSQSRPLALSTTPVLEAVWKGRTMHIDTGCVFGWPLTALRWPELTIVSVPAGKIHATRRRPFLPEPGTVSTP